MEPDVRCPNVIHDAAGKIIREGAIMGDCWAALSAVLPLLRVRPRTAQPDVRPTYRLFHLYRAAARARNSAAPRISIA